MAYDSKERVTFHPIVVDFLRIDGVRISQISRGKMLSG